MIGFLYVRRMRVAIGIVVAGLVLGATMTRALAAPPNETCEQAEGLELPALVNGSTTGAALVQAPTPCGVEDEHAVWYAFEAPAEDRYTFAITGGELADTTLALYDACGGEPIACSDDLAHDLAARVDTYLAAAQKVLIRVAGWGGTRGSFALRVDTFASYERPKNDECEQALPVTQAHPAAATTWNASGTDLSSCGPEDAVDIWYSFVAPAAGEYDFSIEHNAISAHYITVFSDCAGARAGTPGAELACGFLGAHATLAAGQSVVLRVGTNPSAVDWFNVAAGPPPPAEVPPNDSFTGALPVEVPSTTVATTRGATPDALNFGPDCGPYVNAAIWYSFVAPDDGVYVFDTDGSELDDTVVAVFDACDLNGATPPPLFACNDFDGEGDHGRIDGFLEAGASVCIAVAGRFLSDQGGVTLNVSRLGPPPPNDECQGALPIAAGEPVFALNYASVPVDVTSVCPDGNFPLWYSFTAPADGEYKFDTKAGSDAWPDIALYEACGTAETLACSVDAQPAVHLAMKRGENVLVRVSTSVWWRGTIPLRVGPVREETPEPGDEVAEGGAEEVAESEAEVVEEEAEIVEAIDAAEDVQIAETVDDTSDAADGTDGADTGRHRDDGCGCDAGRGDAGRVVAGLVVIGVLGGRRRRIRSRSR